MPQNNLSFVVSSGPTLQNDPQVRTLIRKHAMKNVALTRKRRRDHRPANTQVLLLPKNPTTIPNRTVDDPGIPSRVKPIDSGFVFELGDDQPTPRPPKHRQLIRSRASACHLPRSGAPVFPLSVPVLFTAYEEARSRFQVDLNHLSMLTNFNIGRGTISILSADPSRLLSLSYLQFVPSRYGSSVCLTAATDCLLAKVRSLLDPGKKGEVIELRLYMSALKKLQESLNDESSCASAEVLCASQLLGLRALLGSPENEAWSHHNNGSVHLIKHRTPDRFKEDFDKALFASHVGPVVFECLTSQTPCYLEEPRWMEMHRSLTHISEGLTERSPLAIALRSQMITLPSLWNDIDNTIRGPDLFNDKVQVNLAVRCRKVHQSLLDWVEDYKMHCTRMSLIPPTPQELDKRRELYGTAIECIMVVKRLLATVSVGEMQKLEMEAQDLAQALLDLQSQPSPKHSWLFAGHEVGVLQSLLRTAGEWSNPFRHGSVYEEKIALRERYINWTGMLRPM